MNENFTPETIMNSPEKRDLVEAMKRDLVEAIDTFSADIIRANVQVLVSQEPDDSESEVENKRGHSVSVIDSLVWYNEPAANQNDQAFRDVLCKQAMEICDETGDLESWWIVCADTIREFLDRD